MNMIVSHSHVNTVFSFSSLRPGVCSRAERIQRCCEDFKEKLEELNKRKMAEVQDHLNTAISNFVANAKYRFVDGHGPRLGRVCAKEPLMWKYAFYYSCA